MPRSDVIEVRINGGWKQMSVAGSLAAGERYGRCIECGKRARCHAKAKDGAAAHVEHIRRNPKCSRSDHRIP